MFAKTIFVLCLGLFSADFSYNMFQASAGTATSGGIYTAAQAERGKATYGSKCAFCHGPTLDGQEPYPPLNNDEFIAKYDNKSVTVLFEKIHQTMPGTSPGSLTRPEVADLVAFILSSNHYLAGTAELPSDAESLAKIQLSAPPKP